MYFTQPLLLFLSCFLISVNGANILIVAPMPAPSHFVLLFRLAEELIARGHTITCINPLPQKQPVKNYKDVSTAEVADYVEGLRREMFKNMEPSPAGMKAAILTMGSEISIRTFENENVQNLMKSNEKFDLVIVEHFVFDALIGIGHHFKAPIILFSSTGPSSGNNYIFGNPAPSSYVPSFFIGSFTTHMSFTQRLVNFLVNTAGDAFRDLMLIRPQRAIFKKYINSDVDLDDVVGNVSLMFTNSHVSINEAVPLVPSIIEVGGLHIKPAQKLPKDLKQFLDSSTEGVILFSMGSNLKSTDFKAETRDALLNAFATLKQKVLWKFEADLDVPANVKISKWLPQQDVLAHPNVVAFISHGGLLSTIEAVYFAVPVIGIPCFGDQKNNIATAVANGYAVSIDVQELTEEKLVRAVNEILENPGYRQNIEQRSKLLHDQPMKPMDRAVFWTEYVLRNGGASHLRSAAGDLAWYEREMIDIFLFLFVVTSVVVVLFYKCVKCLVGLCKRKSKKDKNV